MDKTKCQNCTTEPTFIDDEHDHIYVTFESTRKAACEVVSKYMQFYKDEVALLRNKIYDEILEKYLASYIPSNDEKQKGLIITNTLTVYCEKGNGRSEYYKIQNLHKAIKPVAEPVKISCTYFLALCNLDDREKEMKSIEEDRANDLFEELMYMRDKKCIETNFPEIVPLLEFENFVYDIEYWKDMLSKIK